MTPWTDLKASARTGQPEGPNIAMGTDAVKHSGDWSVHLDLKGVHGSESSYSDAYLKIYIGEKGIDMTLQELVDGGFTWWTKKADGAAGHMAYAAIKLTDATGAEVETLEFKPWRDDETIDITSWTKIESANATKWDKAWQDTGNFPNEHPLSWYLDPTHDCSGGVKDWTPDPDAKVKWVQIILNYDMFLGDTGPSAPWVDTDVYVDDVTCGDTNFPIELGFIPDLGLNVKGAEAYFYLSCAYAGHGQIVAESQVEDITLTAGLLTPAEVTQSDTKGTVASGVPSGGDSYYAQTCVQATTVGDIHIRAKVISEDGSTHYVYAEKKWGELHHTILDVDASTTTVEHEKTVRREAGETETETLKDTVWAEFLELTNPQTAGGAVVHWWLFKDDDLGVNQAKIDAIMAALAANDGFLTDAWSATGKYDPDSPPIAAINTLHATQHATDTEWTAVDPAGTIYTIDATDTYAKNTTEDDLPGDVRGTAQATLLNDGTDEKVMIVVLVDYPVDKHGENRICIEKGKKEFTTVIVPPPYLEKIPQVGWAGEKVTLEQSWGAEYNGYLVSFQLEHPGLGTLEPVGADNYAVSGELVYTKVVAGVARCILDSEDPGQADVKVVLREDMITGATGAKTVKDVVDDGLADIIVQTGMLVYYLKLESITPWEPEPEPVLIDEDAYFGITVSGWFTSSNLSTRPARPVDYDGDGNIDAILPAGRWILPDDWRTLAGAHWKTLRPHWDLMDAWSDDITSTDEWGPYDSDVNTPAPPVGPGKAEYPVIGPFSLLQPFGATQWLATASVPADATVSLTGLDVRCTVVPDGELNWWDCPMPPVKIIFNADSDLSTFDKGDAVITAGVYEMPFYASEIPATPYIPPMVAGNGYEWDSWNIDPASATDKGPYDFWTDLKLSPLDKEVLEVYSDNHGFAGVTIDALSGAGSVIISATADYPYLTGKHGAMKSDEVTQSWGEVPPEFVTWDFPYGPEVFPRHYDGAEVNLGTLTGIPAEVYGVYWLDETEHEWKYFVPGLDPSLYTLHKLEYCEIYLIAVADDCTWEISQD
jgi:hypothetical protein